jgi:hypothetical protein
MAAEAPSVPEGEPEARAVLAADETAGDATDPLHDEGNLGRVPGPDFAAGTAGTVDAALESHPHGDEPAFPSDPAERDAPLSGIGASSTGDSSPGDEAEAVSTAEGSFAPGGEESEVWDWAAPDELTANETASTPAGGDPELAWGPDRADESAGVVVLRSYPDAPPLADVDYGAGASEGEIAVEWARESRDQALEEIAGAMVAGEISSAALGMEATSEDGPDGDEAGDNGIAPDASGHIQPAEAALKGDATSEDGPVGDVAGDNGIAPDASSPVQPAEIEDASTQDRGEVAGAPAVPSDRPNRPTVGTLLASLRGQRPRVGPVHATKSGPGATSPGRGVRSGRGPRVSPGLRNPSRRRPGRSNPPCRTFPPRSPPALAERS